MKTINYNTLDELRTDWAVIDQVNDLLEKFGVTIDYTVRTNKHSNSITFNHIDELDE